MKIVLKSNFDLDLFTERFIAENVEPYYGKKMVHALNEIEGERSSYYFELVENDYKLYDGYKELLGG